MERKITNYFTTLEIYFNLQALKTLFESVKQLKLQNIKSVNKRLYYRSFKYYLYKKLK